MTSATGSRTEAPPRWGLPAPRGLLGAAAPPLVYLVVAWWLFRGTSGLGMEFDEVFRVNNLLPVLHPGAEPYNQAISWVTIGPVTIPLMYKEYVSSAFLAAFVPLGVLDDPLSGIRALYFGYTVLAASLGFWLFRSRAWWVAAVVPLLALVSPLLYPDLTYGFVDTQHAIPLLLGVWFFRRYLRGGRARDVWWAALLTAAAVNISFYTSWLVVGLLAAGVLLYPRALLSVLTGWRTALALVAGATIGLVNYVWYNLTAGFPSVAPLVNRIFFPDRYADQPIDFRQSEGVLAEIGPRLRYVLAVLGPLGEVYLGVIVVAAAVTAWAAARALRAGRLREVRLHLVPLIATVVAFGVILISPNTTRRGHYGMLVGLIELTLVAAFLLLVRLGPPWRPQVWRRVAVLTTVALLALTAGTSRWAIDRVVRTGGAGYFSDAIFDLADHLEREQIGEDEVLQVQWGSFAQLYFLSDGEFDPPVAIFDVLAAPDEATRVSTVLAAARAQGGTVLVPVYTDVAPPAGVDVTDLLEAVAEASGGDVCTTEVFTDRIGQEQIRLYRLVVDGVAPGTPVEASRTCPAGE